MSRFERSSLQTQETVVNNQSSPEEMSWKMSAACDSDTADLFFSNDPSLLKRARAICRTCEVAEECLAHAIRHNERHGIWGGKSRRERLELVASDKGENSASSDLNNF